MINKIIKNIIVLILLSCSNNTWSQWKTILTSVSSTNSIDGRACVDKYNNYYVSCFKDSNGKPYIKKWNGTAWNTITDSGANFFSFSNSGLYPITSMTTDKFGNLYVASVISPPATPGNSHFGVVKWDGNSWVDEIGPYGIQGRVNYLTTDTGGNLYAAGQFVNQFNYAYVTKFDLLWYELGGNNTSTFNSFVPSQFNLDLLTTDLSGNVYFINNGRTYKYDGTRWDELGGSGVLISGTAIRADKSGNIYVLGNGIQKFDGVSWSVVSGGLTDVSSFNSFTLDSSNNIYVGYQHTNGKYYVAKYDGIIWTTIGGTNASFTKAISRISTDNFGNIYIITSTSNNLKYVAQYLNCSTSTSTTNLSICSTQLPYTWNGKTLNTSGIIIDTLTNASGCDSIATLNLIVKSNSSSITNLTICPNALPYTWNGLTFNGAGSQTAHLTNSVGCDSAATLNLSVNTQPTPAPNSVCVGSTLQLTNATSGGIWSSANNRATVNLNGLVTGTNPGMAVITYKKNNITTSYNILVHPTPNVPSIAYGAGSVNPQLGAPAGSFCINKTFGVIGIPSGGVFETGNSAILNINCSGIVNTVGVGSSYLKYTYTNAQGCSNSRTITGSVVNCANRSVNINEQSRIYSNFNLYPNPTKNIVNIKIDNLVGKGTLILTNLLGKQIKQQLLSLGNNSIDVSQLARGVYIVNVITEQGSENKKLLIE